MDIMRGTKRTGRRRGRGRNKAKRGRGGRGGALMSIMAVVA